MRLERIANVADARRAARRRLPRVIFDYVDGAADDETTMRENEAVFDEVVFRPHMGMGVSSPDLSTTVLGTEVALPILLAPCGLVRAMHPDAGVGVARAAASRGTLSVLSTVAGSPVEDVVAAAPGRVWFQLYSSGGRPDAEQVCARAAAAGVSVLVVTIDTPALGNRERDIHHGVAPPLRIGAHNALHLGPQVLSRPMWTYRMARDGLDVLGRAPGRAASGRAAASGRSGRSAGRSA
ncbi:MAG: alpha-hydroxy acid oxidase, partial [Acidimicrobiales bacterium]